MSNSDPRVKGRLTAGTQVSSGRPLLWLLLIAVVGFVLFVAVMLLLEKLGLVFEGRNKVGLTSLGAVVFLIVGIVARSIWALMSRPEK